MFRVIQFTPFEAYYKALKIWQDNPNKVDEEINEVFLNQKQIIEADLGEALMLLQADYQKILLLKQWNTFANNLEKFIPKVNQRDIKIILLVLI